jgi:hypothetical protein
VVVYPVVMLVYCFSRFGLDRTKIGINLEIFPVGWFEQNASVIADPVQTEVIYTSLGGAEISVRISSFAVDLQVFTIWENTVFLMD